MKKKTERQCLDEQAEINKKTLEGMQLMIKRIRQLEQRVEALEGRQRPIKIKPDYEDVNPIKKVLVRVIRW